MKTPRVRQERIRVLNAAGVTSGPIAYWMSRDQRTRENWSLLFARELALAARQSLAVIFCLVPDYLGASAGHYSFMLDGLAEVEQTLARLNIPLVLVSGEPGKAIPRFAEENRLGAVVTDFSPLKPNRQWKRVVASALTVPLYEVDAHNIVPAWAASDKQEYGAYTLRPKINRLLDIFLEEFPPMRSLPRSWPRAIPPVDWEAAAAAVKAERPGKVVTGMTPGERAARRQMRHFLRYKLAGYAENANDPVRGVQSGLSPYLHFGQLSAQLLALETLKYGDDLRSQESYLEQLIVRRELSDNFCLYNTDYDNVDGFPRWARETLAAHARDRRQYIYSREALEAAATHDELWNAAQMQMVKTGRMHGYLRMYWAKKILEWTPSAAAAMEYAIYLNDQYELDGRDPNGYTGIAWSIGGVHDRAWGERPVFGKVRYMSNNGARAKFDVDAYIKTVAEL